MLKMTVLLLVGGAFAMVALVRWILDRRHASSRSLPPLFIPVARSRPVPPGTVEMRPAPAPERMVPAAPPPRARAEARSPVDVVDPDLPAPAETVRFYRSADEPVQLLPGWLEVLAGATRHREIRFVRLPGKPLYLFVGRDAGPDPQHIGLGSPTVSRRHARFAYADGRWLVKNLSETNPLVLNDAELSDIDDERPLVDGDRIELGEVVLRFHAQ